MNKIIRGKAATLSRRKFVIGSAAALSSWMPISCSSGWKIWSRRSLRTRPVRMLSMTLRVDGAGDTMAAPIAIMAHCQCTCRATRW